MSSSPANLEKIVSLCKRRGFVFPSAEIYGGVNGLYDYGPLGTLLRNNLRTAWTGALQQLDVTVFFIEGALLGPEALWQASGHVEHFHDPMIDCLVCKHRFRADDIDSSKPCPHCGNTQWTPVRNFNMMFQTQLGASAEHTSLAYLRPETAQVIYTDFKAVATSMRAKIPFGIAQIGKAFRNEITPKQFLFRMREFEQMELEWFCRPEEAHTFFDFWLAKRRDFYATIGITTDRIRIRPHQRDELAHYSQNTSDIEYEFPFGWKELEGIAYRGNFDLSQHSKHSGKELAVFDEETKTSFVPHVVECSVGLDRLMLTALLDAYEEDMAEGELRTVLRLHPTIAPVTAAFFPLTKQQAEPMEQIYQSCKKRGLSVQYDLSGSIGKRYRRQDEIGTPWCFTYDFDTEHNQTVTVRYRDSMQQERIAIDSLADFLEHKK
jgi:glycyl-tRNA synthetase